MERNLEGAVVVRQGDRMKQLRNGTMQNAPQHYSGMRSASGRVLSRARSLTAAIMVGLLALKAKERQQ